MKKIYRDVEIDVQRADCLGGWSEVYWTAFRLSDDFEIACGFGGGTVREMFKSMKMIVDQFLDECHGDPEKWENR